MDIQEQIATVWQAYENNKNIPAFIKERRYGFYDNQQQKDILVLGIAPIYQTKSVCKPTKYNMLHHLGDENNMNAYQRAITKIVINEKENLDLSPWLTYMDLFYYRTDANKSELNTFLSTLDGIMFLIDQLQITKTALEQIIQPKVIVLNSKEAGIFMGIYQDQVGSVCSMGYEFEEVQFSLSSFSVYRIIGLSPNTSLGEDETMKTNLIGTYVICYPSLLHQSLDLEDTPLLPQQIYYYRELVGLEKRALTNKVPHLSAIDVDLLLNHAFLYRYRLKGDRDPSAIQADIILTDLLEFRTLAPQKMVKAIFDKIGELNLLSIHDILELFSFSFCQTTFRYKRAILSTKQTAIRNKNLYFAEPFKLYGNQLFYVSKFWSIQQRRFLEHWFIKLAYYHNN